MPFSLLIIMNVMLVAGAVIQCFGHLAFRPGIFFGVTVDPDFCRTENARRILWLYRRPIIVMTVLCIAALWLAVPRLSGLAAPIAASALIFIEVSGAIVSMAAASRHVRAFAKTQSPIRTVSVMPRKRTLPGGWFPFVGPMLIVGAAWLLLFMRRDSISLEIYRGALALLLWAFVSNGHFMSVAWLVTFRTRQINPSGGAANQESTDRRFGYWLRLGLAYFQTAFLVPAALTIARITPVASPRFVVIWMGSLPVSAMIVMAYVLKRRRLPLDTPGLATGDHTPDACWKWGLIYYNPDDPALIVETRAGTSGCDLNFGNKWSWVVTAVILATPFVIRLLWF